MEEDLFIDSGAWSLFRLHVLKTGKKAEKLGKHGRVLEEPIVEVGQGDYSYYDLSKGSDFRAYCDDYARFMKDRSKQISFAANVDVIGNPDMTWEVQRFFEEEHGWRPVPVVHFGTSMKYLERYLERGYKMIGFGGFARRPDRNKVLEWCDDAFSRVCPASNHRMPVTRIHGFAMTSWHLIRRWPWYSVDSTSWLLYGTYGLICVPHYRKGRFSYDRPPMIVSVSERGRPIDYKTRMHVTNTFKKNKLEVNHDVSKGWYALDGVSAGYDRQARVGTMRWLDYLGIDLTKIAEDSEIRAGANLRYFMELEQSLPPWPRPLDPRIIEAHSYRGERTLGLISRPTEVPTGSGKVSKNLTPMPHMRFYFSGWSGDHSPIGMERRPSFMLTFFDLRKGVKQPMSTLNAYLERKNL